MQSTQPPSSQPKRKSGWGLAVVGIILTAAVSLVLLNQQYIVDSVSFWRYQPTAEIAEITDRTALTDTGKFLFYAAHPVIDGNRTFDAKCDSKEDNSAILGCYAAGRIYIFDVTDKRLAGIKEVTAAHEMLHVAYQRMSTSEKDRIDQLTAKEYEKLKNDPDFAERMAFYARTEPGERDNELHSIIGTEMRSISNELETHYAKYLKDRNKIIEYYESYRKTFVDLDNQKKELSARLDTLGAYYKRASAAYEADVKKLDADIAAFNQRADSGGFESRAQFNSEKAALVSRVNQLTKERDAINAAVVEHNKLKDQLKSIVTQTNELNRSIDSSLAPAPKV